MVSSLPQNQTKHYRQGMKIYKPSLYKTLAEYGDVIEYILARPKIVEQVRRRISDQSERRYQKKCKYLEGVLNVT